VDTRVTSRILHIQALSKMIFSSDYLNDKIFQTQKLKLNDLRKSKFETQHLLFSVPRQDNSIGCLFSPCMMTFLLDLDT
jgi:hypothetical protein